MSNATNVLLVRLTMADGSLWAKVHRRPDDLASGIGLQGGTDGSDRLLCDGKSHPFIAQPTAGAEISASAK